MGRDGFLPDGGGRGEWDGMENGTKDSCLMYMTGISPSDECGSGSNARRRISIKIVKPSRFCQLALKY